MKKLILTGGASLVTACLAYPTLAQPDSIRARGYELIDLGTLGGASSAGLAIDEQADVAGWAHTGSGERRAFFACDGCPLVDLGTLPFGNDSMATDLGDNGAYVAGVSNRSHDQHGAKVPGAFLWHNGTMTPLGALYDPAFVNRRFGHSEAHGVNDSGQVAGFSRINRANLWHSFYWEDGVMLDINGGEGNPAESQAYDINNLGQVVGYYIADAALGGSDRQAFVWEQGVGMSFLPDPAGWPDSTAVAINETGGIAGWSSDGTDSTAVYWAGPAAVDIGTLEGDAGARALDINDEGQIIGWSGSETTGDTRAFLWHEGAMIDLNELLPPNSDWLLLEARDINNQGVIAGTGIHDGELRAFLLKPPAPSAGNRWRNQGRR